MAALSAAQQRTRARVEWVIGAMAPVLDVVLAAGERLSRIVQPTDDEYYPVRPPSSDAEAEIRRRRSTTEADAS
jgi:hypothetical protein